MSRANATFVPVKPKVVFSVLKPMEDETSLFFRFSCIIKTVFVFVLLLSFTLTLDTIKNHLLHGLSVLLVSRSSVY